MDLLAAWVNAGPEGSFAVRRALNALTELLQGWGVAHRTVKGEDDVRTNQEQDDLLLATTAGEYTS